MVVARTLPDPTHRRRPWRAVGLPIVLTIAVVGSLMGPQAEAVADTRSLMADTREAYNAHFATSFEAGDVQPDWSDATVQSDGVVKGGSNGEPGMRTFVDDGPSEALIARPHVGFTGVQSLQYAGEQTAEERGYAYNEIFDVEMLVSADTTLSYKIFPALMNDENLGEGLPSPSTFISVDIAFEDGTYLRELGAEDQSRFELTAHGQGASKVLQADQWNSVESHIGQVAEGKTITRILLNYDNPQTGVGSFQGWIDDIAINDNPPTTEREHLSDWVITTRGTNDNRDFSRGLTFPATAVPHGFNFWTPVTDAGTTAFKYQYQENNNAENFPEIQALSLSHQGYVWGGERHTWQVMPAAGSGEPDPDREARALPFSHEREIAKPYHYSVTANNGVQMEIAPANRAAVMRFTFTEDTSNLIFDNVTNDGGLTLHPEEGAVSAYTQVGESRDRPMFVYATFDQPVTDSGMLPDSGRPDVTGYVQFDTSAADQKTVTMRVATSLMSVDQARRNLELEIPGSTTFQSVANQARDLWDDKLDVITDVEGATPDQLTTLYSNLYRLSLYPNATYENTGTAENPIYEHTSMFAPFAGENTATETGAQILPGKAYRPSNFWDTYRTAWPAHVLFYPEMTGELLDGALTQYTEGGWLSTTMVGTNSDVTLADAYVKGVDFDVETAYDAAVKNATVASGNTADGRAGMDESIFLGYTPLSTREGMSEALENYLNDFGIAMFSRALAEQTDPADPLHERYDVNASYFLDRAQHYVNMFDPNVEFFQGRHSDGQWRLPPDEYDPRVWGHDYTETNGWGMAFSVPHDGQGLANLLGGRQQLEDKLDTFFSTPETAQFPGSYGSRIHEMTEAAYVQMGQWGVSNQPAHHIPYMYNYVGAPAKAQEKIREALSRLFVGSEIGQGYTGDEDTGEMSAWHIFGALGFYPLQVGTDQYTIGSPLFTSATINLENGNEIVVNAPNNSPENVYVQGLQVNGEPYDSTSISHDLLTAGAELTFDMGSEPSAWGTGADAAPESLTTGDEPPNPMRDLTEARHGTATSSENGADVLFDDTSNTELVLASAEPSVTWEFVGGTRETARFYTLTSGAEPGDPTRWTLQGSQDGEQWETLDGRTDETFRWRNQTRVFEVDDPDAYSHYRLEFAATESAASLAEIELLGYRAAQDETVAANMSPDRMLALPAEESTELTFTLNVSTTAPGSVVQVDTEAPDGWIVAPADAEVAVGPDAEEQLPLTVTIPAGTAEGDYTVAAIISPTDSAPFRLPVTVHVTEGIEFGPATREEARWLWDAGDSQVDGENNRFADNDSTFVYQFPLPANADQAVATLLMDNQFRVEVSNDAENWTEVLVEERQIRDGSNRNAYDIDLAPYLGGDNVIYLRVSDSFPEDGWGARLSSVTIDLSGSSTELPDIIDFRPATSDEARWLFDVGGSQIDNVGNRYADGDRYFIYRFPLPAAAEQASATLVIDNQFLVEASSDADDWTEVLIEERDIRDGSNWGSRDVDLTPFLGEDGVVYLRVSDSFPDNGWGPRLSRVIVTWRAEQEPVMVTPEAVTFTDEPGTEDDTYTIPEVEGVEYLLGEDVLDAGTYGGVGTVTITARAAEGFQIVDGALVEWSWTFSTADGGQPQPDNRTAEFHLSNSWRASTDVYFMYGRWADEVFIGDWDGDGDDTIVVRRGSQFHVTNDHEGGSPDVVFHYGRPDDVILVGDWDGDGVDTFAVRRDSTYHVKNSLRGGEADVVVNYGRSGDQVLVGDWNGDGIDTFAVRRGSVYHVKNSLRGGEADVVVNYGRETDVTHAGDWNGDGRDTLAVQRGRTFYVNDSLRGGDADRVVIFGRLGDEVHVGDWDGNGTDTLGVRRPVGAAPAGAGQGAGKVIGMLSKTTR